jgi:hypothetical protein
MTRQKLQIAAALVTITLLVVVLGVALILATTPALP